MAARLTGTALTLAKGAVLGGWALGAAAWVVPGLGAARWIVPGLLGAHAIESWLFMPRLRRLGRELADDLPPLLVYGMVHYFSVDHEAKES